METKHSDWMPSQYMDTDEWGILNQDNEIMVGIASRLTKERAEFICRAVNDNARLREALEYALKIIDPATVSNSMIEKLEAALAGKGETKC